MWHAPKSLLPFLSALFLLTSPTTHARPGEESYFHSDGGVARDAGGLPEALEPDQTLTWRVPLDPGHSTPLLLGDRLILTTWKADTKELATVALDATTGKTLWRTALSPKQVEQTHEIGSPATASVASDGQRFFAFFGSAGLFCYDQQGKQLWQKSLGPFRDEYGAGSSPIVFQGKVILNQDHDIDSFLIAVDAATGQTLWKTTRPDAVRSYSTPVIWQDPQGHPQILVAGALQLTAYEPEHGDRLWWLNGLARIVIPTPVTAGQLIYAASWAPGGDASRRISFDTWPEALAKWDSNHDGKLSKAEIDNHDVLDRFYRMDLNQDGVLDETEWERQAAFFTRARNSLLAFKPSGRGELPESAVVWKYEKGIPYVPSPVLYHSILWMVKEGGIVTKLDAGDGHLLQEERVPGGGNYFASPVAGDSKVFFASQSGTVSIMSAESAWKVISSHDFHEKIYATPVLQGGRVYVRTDQALYCFQGQSETNHETWLKTWRAANPAWRGVHLIVRSDEQAGQLLEALPRLAASGVNVVIVETDYAFEFQAHPELRGERFITKARAHELARAARALGIRLIPQLNCLGHQSWAKTTDRLLTKYPQFDETPGQYPDNKGIYCRSWCPQHPEVHQVVFSLIDELVDGFEADAFHAGMDEVFIIGSEHCPRCRGGDPAKLFAKAVNDLHGHIVGERKLEMLIWGDRLLDAKALGYSEWEASKNDTHGAADLVPKDLIVCDWHYGKQAQYPSVPFLLAKGFRVWPSGWQPLEASQAFSAFARREEDPNLVGFLCTTWGKVKIPDVANWPPLSEVLGEWKAGGVRTPSAEAPPAKPERP